MGSPLVFISYSRHDLQFAMRLVNDLVRDSVNVWIDKINIPPGARWDKEIEHALNSADTIIVILTPNSVVSNNVRDEISYALQADIKLIPVYALECRIPLRIHSLEYVYFVDNYDSSYRSLLDELQRHSFKLQRSLGIQQKDRESSQRYTEYRRQRSTLNRQVVRDVIPAALTLLALVPGLGVLMPTPVLPIENHLDKIAFLILCEVGAVLLLTLIWYNKQYLFSLGKRKLNRLAIISFIIFLTLLICYLGLCNSFIVEVPEYDPVLMPLTKNSDLSEYIAKFGGTPEAVIINHGRDSLVEAIQLYSKKDLLLTVITFGLIYNLIYLPIVFALNLIYLKIVED